MVKVRAWHLGWIAVAALLVALIIILVHHPGDRSSMKEWVDHDIAELVNAIGPPYKAVMNEELGAFDVYIWIRNDLDPPRVYEVTVSKGRIVRVQMSTRG